jgi:hypothetical protein
MLTLFSLAPGARTTAASMTVFLLTAWILLPTPSPSQLSGGACAICKKAGYKECIFGHGQGGGGGKKSEVEAPATTNPVERTELV